MSARITVIALTIMLAATIPCAADTAVWAGMTLADPTDAQLTEIENAYGEPAGLVVQAVADGSMAAATGILAADVLMCVRMPDDTDWYPICDLEEMAEWIPDNAPNDRMRLMVLRKVGADWQTLKGWLGKAFGAAVDEGVLEGGEALQSHVQGDVSAGNFLSTDPMAVIAVSPGGVQLTQQHTDIFCGTIAWSFATRLTEAQKAITRDAVIEFWNEATAADTQSFEQGLQMLLAFMPQMNPQQREQMRMQYAAALLQMAAETPDEPLAQMIFQVSGNAGQALAGAGTAWPLTQQDVDALIEYTSFQTQVMTGRPVILSMDQRAQIAQQTIAQYNAGTDAQKQALSQMDEYWAALRVQWARAQVAQQQALQQQWQQGYQQQYQAAPQYYGGAPAAGGGMSQSTYDTLSNVLNMEHQASMSAIGAIDGEYDTDLYDAGGDFMYSY